MEKNITLSANSLFAAGLVNTVVNFVAGLRSVFSMPFEALRRYYGHVLERELNRRQTWLLVHAQVAFLFAAFACGGALLLRLAFCVWFLLAVLQCKRALA